MRGPRAGFFLLLLLLCLGACGAPCGPDAATVSRVIDGDTLELEGGTTVRLLGVDAPETTKGKHDCFGAEATAFIAATALGRGVRLSYGSQCVDRYQRLLAFVTVDGVDLSQELVSGGYACPYMLDRLSEAEATALEDLGGEAERARRGMWGKCDGVRCAGR